MKTPKSIRIDDKTKDKIDKLVVETSWVELKTYDDKINFLVWYYKNNKK